MRNDGTATDFCRKDLLELFSVANPFTEKTHRTAARAKKRYLGEFMIAASTSYSVLVVYVSQAR